MAAWPSYSRLEEAAVGGVKFAQGDTRPRHLHHPIDGAADRAVHLELGGRRRAEDEGALVDGACPGGHIFIIAPNLNVLLTMVQ
jgi:hypothetical protein